jgi:hypothetical protein
VECPKYDERICSLASLNVQQDTEFCVIVYASIKGQNIAEGIRERLRSESRALMCVIGLEAHPNSLIQTGKGSIWRVAFSSLRKIKQPIALDGTSFILKNSEDDAHERPPAN